MKMLIEIVPDKGEVSSYEVDAVENEQNQLCFQLPVAVPLGFSFRLHCPTPADRPKYEFKMNPPAGSTDVSQT